MFLRVPFAASAATAILSLGFALIASNIAVSAEEPDVQASQIDPKALDLMRKSAEFLASRRSIAFNWFVSYDEVVDEREKLTLLRSGSNLLVRDKGLYSHAEGENGVRDYYFNGHKFVVAAPGQNFFAVKDFDGSFEALVEAAREATDTEIPLYAIMSRDLPKNLESGLKRAVDLGITYVAGSEVRHLAFSDEEEDWQVWISTNDEAPLPLLIVGTESKKVGWPQYRAYLTDWDLNPQFEASQFNFSPAAGDVQITFPELASKTPGEDDKPAEPNAKSEAPAAGANTNANPAR